VRSAVHLQKSKYRALHLAAMSGSAAVVAVLLEAGAWVDARSQARHMWLYSQTQHSQHVSQLVVGFSLM
jgi:ankyrin repeat protein